MVEVLNEKEFDNIINENDKVLIDVYATWCGPCKMLAPIIDELASEIDDYKFYKLDIDSSLVLAEQYGIMSIPTLLIFENGKLKSKEVGFKSKEELKNILNG